jgi:geranylgeranyl diphosphate synthase type I
MVAAMTNRPADGGSRDPADLARIRAGVEDALGGFLGRQRSMLAGISEELAEAADAITDLLAGGKRLRPAFCYWGWRACGGADIPAIFAAAGALELLHASALVHDDVIDASDTRRGRPAVHRRFAATHAAERWRGSPDAFGAGAAILVGDLLLAWTDEMLRDCGLPAAAVWRGLGMLDTMRTEVFAGQFLDLTGQASATSALDCALTVITYKSAKYTVERPLHLGAALAAVTAPDASAALTQYGIPLGVAFQLRDDILGVFGDPARTGKPVTGDLREGKRTVLLALSWERADERQCRVLDRSVGDPGLTEHGAELVRSVITETGALAECEAMIDRDVKEALAALEEAPITAESKTALAHLAVAATSRAQ